MYCQVLTDEVLHAHKTDHKICTNLCMLQITCQSCAALPALHSCLQISLFKCLDLESNLHMCEAVVVSVHLYVPMSLNSARRELSTLSHVATSAKSPV